MEENERKLIKKIFSEIVKELYHRDKIHFEYNSQAIFRKLERIRKKYMEMV